MNVVIDANNAAAALLSPDGWTARQLDRSDVKWLAPAYLFDELQAHLEAYATKADVAEPDFRNRIQALQDRVEAVGQAELLAVENHPMVQAADEIDPDDAVYLAAVVASEANLLWTRDRALLDAFEGLAVQVVPGPDAGSI